MKNSRYAAFEKRALEIIEKVEHNEDNTRDSLELGRSLAALFRSIYNGVAVADYYADAECFEEEHLDNFLFVRMGFSQDAVGKPLFKALQKNNDPRVLPLVLEGYLLYMEKPSVEELSVEEYYDWLAEWDLVERRFRALSFKEQARVYRILVAEASAHEYFSDCGWVFAELVPVFSMDEEKKAILTQFFQESKYSIKSWEPYLFVAKEICQMAGVEE